MIEHSTIDKVTAAVEAFKALLDPSVRGEIQLTPVYRTRSLKGNEIHWPKNWEDVWGKRATGGVYMHFDEDDTLLYVGKAVALGPRLNAYYRYVDHPRDLSCHVNDARLSELNATGIRAVILDGPLKFFGPALEWYLIETLHPPLNKLGRVDPVPAE